MHRIISKNYVYICRPLTQAGTVGSPKRQLQALVLIGCMHALLRSEVRATSMIRSGNDARRNQRANVHADPRRVSFDVCSMHNVRRQTARRVRTSLGL